MLHLVAPEPCYTEEDVQYKVENMGLDNVDISEQTSAEACRANCRYFQVTILYRSQLIEFPFYRTFEAAKYFTYNTGNSKCRCKPDMDMGAVRQDKTGRISGNVECDIVMTGGCAGTAGGCGGSGKVLLSKNVGKDCSKGSSLSGKLLPLDLPQCYTEEDALYKVEDVGGSALGTSSQATWEECRSHCRYHQTINLHHITGC